MFNWDNQLPGVYVLLSNLTGYQNTTFTAPVRPCPVNAGHWTAGILKSTSYTMLLHVAITTSSGRAFSALSTMLLHGSASHSLLSSCLPRSQAEAFLGWWLDAGKGVARTPAFASWLGPTGAMRNQANAALLAWVYGKGSRGGPGKLLCWAEFQVRLGSRRCNRIMPCIALQQVLLNQPNTALLGVWQA